MTTWQKRQPEAYRAAWRKWYRANAAKKMEWQRRRRRERRAWLHELKGQLSCEKCGERSPACLHFHHEDRRRKDITVAHAVAAGWPKDRVLAEIAKCRVLCANCHAKHHWNERHGELSSG